MPAISAATQPSFSAATAVSLPDSAAMNACVRSTLPTLEVIVKSTELAMTVATMKPTSITTTTVTSTAPESSVRRRAARSITSNMG